MLGEAVNDPVEQIISKGDQQTAALSYCTLQATDSPGKTLTGSGVTAVDVPGLGDAAFWGASEPHVFVDGNLYLSVNVRGLDDALALARATGVARAALERAR